MKILSVLCLAFTLFIGIHAHAQQFICRKNNNLTIRAKCKSGETKLTVSKLASLGAVGPTGATGPTGPTGLTGSTGETGASAFDDIPSGETVYGVIGLDTHLDSAASRDFSAFASLPALAPSTLTSSSVILANIDTVNDNCSAQSCLDPSEVSASGSCTGSAAAPTAASGTVCIYTISLSASKTDPQSLFALPVIGLNGRAGFEVRMATTASATGDYLFNAVWAYTAP